MLQSSMNKKVINTVWNQRLLILREVAGKLDFLQIGSPGKSPISTAICSRLLLCSHKALEFSCVLLILFQML